MTTLLDTVKPSTAYLEEILPQALTGRTEQEYVAAYLGAMVLRLQASPRLYHLYGPWWPALKNLLLESGDVSLGQIIDSDTVAIYQMNRPALTVLAAQLYADERIETDAIYNAVHMLEVASYADDTEPYIYVSYDESIEKYRI
ncbi:olxA (plasmid) [Raoultella ornithinolytica]|uniref:olxA n=1 Tax=Raoultella ornithinolytica TaxID=54291 RepID=UPI00292AD039|nr:olxA [Raoultella ornithinolytica]MDV1094926.1 olxA [Raoultella ornithinolytica]MDV1122730.1 olxA [Raoultella ornithinolytica]MDV1893245.1 olxA [Raoultella ornithinolytica]